ncbi:MFS transporter [Bosea thiooxidans]
MARAPLSIGSASPAFTFVLLMGAVDFFGDTTYSGGASMNGPFLASLGAGAALVSITAGGSEFLNYLIRGISGYVADKTGKYWRIAVIGYVLNLIAVPAIALTGHWSVATALILLQGVGRGMRKPIIEAMLSYTTGQHGKGWVYGVHNALDAGGRTVGPLVIALLLFLHGDQRTGYAVLAIPCLLALASLIFARFQFPVPARLEEARSEPSKPTRGFTPAYWLYMLAGACFAAGLMNFELIAYFLSSTRLAENYWVPLFLAFGTASGVIASLGLGKLYDRIGLPVILAAVLLTSLFSPLVFFGGFNLALLGMALWGIGQVTQDMLLKAVVAGVLPENRRNLAFGLFFAGYGGGWLLGSITTGLLYEQSRLALVLFAVVVQLGSLPIFVLARRWQDDGGTDD